MKRWLTHILGISLLLSVSVPRIALAEADYAAPAAWLLPWAKGERYTVTWTPPEHWQHGNSVGMAFDFATPEGTPLFAPASGTAHFRTAPSAAASNLGNYVDIIAGDWLLRLAHLRDIQVGEREVRAGEWIGYAGSSGASAPHLHFEVLVRSGTGWAAPDMGRTPTLMGLPLDAYSLGAAITSPGCVAQVRLENAIQPARDAIALGEITELLIPLYNLGAETIEIETLEVHLHTFTGDALRLEAAGPWDIPGRAGLTIPVPVCPDLPGDWQVDQITYRMDGETYTIGAQGVLHVQDAPAQVLELTSQPVYQVGERLSLEIRLHNPTERAFVFDDLMVSGLRPDQTRWSLALSAAGTLAPGEDGRFAMLSPTILQQVGAWRVQTISFKRAGRWFTLEALANTVTVLGSELQITDVTVHASEDMLQAFVMVRNVGTAVAFPQRIVLWGWQSEQARQFSLAATHIAPLAPGESALLRLQGQIASNASPWRLVEAGYWQEGNYLRLRLPAEVSILYGQAAPENSQQPQETALIKLTAESEAEHSDDR